MTRVPIGKWLSGTKIGLCRRCSAGSLGRRGLYATGRQHTYLPRCFDLGFVAMARGPACDSAPFTLAQDRAYFWSHVAAAVVHIGSAFTILTIGLTGKTDCFNKYNIELLPWAQIRRWKYVCVQNRTIVSGFACPDKELFFYADPPWGPAHIVDPCNSKHGVNLLALAVSFAFVSGVCHLIGVIRMCARRQNRLPPGEARFLRWLDYAFSAPLMLAVVGIVFSASNNVAVVAAPAFLSVLLVLSGFIEPSCPAQVRKKAAVHSSTPLFVGLLIAYAGVWVPVFAAVATNSDSVVPDSGRAKAPKFVTTMLGITFGIFLTFPAVYALDFDYGNDWLLGKQKAIMTKLGGRERVYTALSMIAKVTLHVFLALSVLSQPDVLSHSKEAAARKSRASSDNDIEMGAIVGTIGVVVGSILVNSVIIPFAVKRWTCRSRSSAAGPDRELLLTNAPTRAGKPKGTTGKAKGMGTSRIFRGAGSSSDSSRRGITF